MKTTHTARFAAMAFAALVTFGLLGSVDYLATSEPAPTVMATTPQPRG